MEFGGWDKIGEMNLEMAGVELFDRSILRRAKTNKIAFIVYRLSAAVEWLPTVDDQSEVLDGLLPRVG